MKKLGDIPDGGGWRFVDRAEGYRKRSATAGKTGKRGIAGDMAQGTAFVHTVIDDHSRVAYAEIHGDGKAVTAISVQRRATSWFSARGVTVAQVVSDNGSVHRSHAWRDACRDLSITPRSTRPRRPQTNGRTERFHRPLADGRAFSGTTTPNQPVEQQSRPGSAARTTIGPTPPSAASHPSTRPTDLLARAAHLVHAREKGP